MQLGELAKFPAKGGVLERALDNPAVCKSVLGSLFLESCLGD